MDRTVCLFIIGVSIVSARHTLDVNRDAVQSQIYPNHSSNDRYSAQDVERRNVDHSSNVHSNREPSHSDAAVRTNQPVHGQRQYTVDYSYPTESDHVALISEKVEASNNIGNDENQFKLRTNAYPTKTIEMTEYTTESIDNHKQRSQTNTGEQNVQNRYGGSEVSTKERSRAQNNDRLSSPLHNHRSKLNNHGEYFVKNHRSLPMDREMGFIPHEIQPSQNNGESPSTNVRHDIGMRAKTNQGNTLKSVAVENKHRAPETVNVRPIEESNISTSQSGSTGPTSNRGVEESGRIPKEKEVEIQWVWGSEPETQSSTTEADGLDDRAAFDGSGCATGLVKVMGVCVEKH